MPGAGGTVKLARDIGKSKTMEMVLTGDNISADDALKYGMINQVFDNNELLIKGAFSLADKIASKSQITAAMCKASVKYATQNGEIDGLFYERSLTRGSYFTEDMQIGLQAFI